ncbi:hypothetical protein [Methylococcus geothermalis]|uniref:Uncharacterized protein n=1 Tax=Methylococcus geothermalis TaxID=2681310 RepID=A0A858Q821_9GAMM|nr:hypothetical protein [Methylococcus geothermalis]QJD29951.1 hypothetical protein GNH96_08190 [Methylococcus geothermalis]
MHLADRSPLALASQTLGASVICLRAAGVHQPSETAPQVSEAETCKSLNHGVSQADDDFKDIELNVGVDPLVNRWDTKAIFPESDGDVLDWGGGRLSYGCVRQESDQSTARQNDEENPKLAARGMGKEWHASEQPGKTGEITPFSKAGEDTRIELRSFQERAPAARWQTSVTIGDRITPNAH